MTMNINPDQKSFWLLIFTTSSPRTSMTVEKILGTGSVPGAVVST